MEPFVKHSGVAASLPRANVDTDVIIRIEKLITLGRTELGPDCFAAIRYRADGSENPDFVLNQAPYRGASILIAGRNFGCGSSREGAVWALQCIGIRCVIAPSFGGIFYSNCFQNGILPIALDDAVVADLAARADGAEFTVDLEAQVIAAPGGQEVAFTVPPLRREQLLKGLDAIGVTQLRADEIAAFQERDRQARPWAWPAAAE